jgi:hypothetical protein
VDDLAGRLQQRLHDLLSRARSGAPTELRPERLLERDDGHVARSKSARNRLRVMLLVMKRVTSKPTRPEPRRSAVALPAPVLGIFPDRRIARAATFNTAFPRFERRRLRRPPGLARPA